MLESRQRHFEDKFEHIRVPNNNILTTVNYRAMSSARLKIFPLSISPSIKLFDYIFIAHRPPGEDAKRTSQTITRRYHASRIEGCQ